MKETKPTINFRCKNCKKAPKWKKNREIQSLTSWTKKKGRARTWCRWCGKILYASLKKKPEKHSLFIDKYGTRKVSFCSVCGKELYWNNNSGLCRYDYLRNYYLKKGAKK